MKQLRVVLLLALIFNLAAYPAQGEEAKMGIHKGSQVAFDYTLTVDGEVADTSEGREPMQYTHGEGKIIPGLSRQLEGLHEGDEKKIEVFPEEAYGAVNPKAFQEVPRSQLPPDLKPQVGVILQAKSPEGGSIPVRITQLKEDAVVVDFNHPFAGKTLTFQVKIVSVE